MFLVLLGILLIALKPIEDPDFWWHLKTGELIAQEHQVPHFDGYSFTAAGKPWIAHEWLSELIIFKLYDWGGFILPIISFAILILIAFGLTIFRCDDRSNLYTIGFSLILGAIMSTPIWGVKPQVFSILYTSLFLFFLDRYIKNQKILDLLPLPVIMLFWVNQHGSFIVGIGIIAIYLLGILIDSVFSIYKEAKSIRSIFSKTIFTLAITLIICTLVALLNPNGARILLYPFQTIGDPSIRQFVQEWAAPDFQERTWIPLAVMYLALIGFSLKSRRSISTINLLLCLVLGYAALSAVKHVPLFALVSIPVLAYQMSSVIHIPVTEFRKNWLSTSFILLVLIGSLIFVTSNVLTLKEKQQAIIQKSLPVYAVDLIKKNGLDGQLFNSYNWGGYLIWNLYPEQKVYIDGRCDMYGADFMKHYVNIYFAMDGWQEALDKENIKYVLVEPNTSLANALRQSSKWTLIFTDEVSVFYRRN